MSQFLVCVQEVVVQVVEGVDLYVVYIEGQYGGQVGQYFFGCFVCEGDGYYVVGVDLVGLQQLGDVCCQYVGFVGVSVGEDQGWFGGCGDGGQLFGVEVFEEGIVVSSVVGLMWWIY